MKYREQIFEHEGQEYWISWRKYPSSLSPNYDLKKFQKKWTKDYSLGEFVLWREPEHLFGHFIFDNLSGRVMFQFYGPEFQNERTVPKFWKDPQEVQERDCAEYNDVGDQIIKHFTTWKRG